MTEDLAEVRGRWAVDSPTFERFGCAIADMLRVGVARRGIWCEVESRAKEPHSLLKKLLVGKYTYMTLPDRVGARCVVRYRHELNAVLEVAGALFQCGPVDRKAEALGFTEVGYQSDHVDVRLRADDAQAGTFPPNQFWAELQVRTMGQHLWSEMSHDTFYKNASLVEARSPDLKRRIHLMAGLIEVADREFERLGMEADDPVVELLGALERQYYKYSILRPDVELSLQIIKALVGSYGEPTKAIRDRLDAFVATHEVTIRAVYEQADPNNSSPLLWQPEALMVYERLDHDDLAARRALADVLPEREVEKLAVTFGFSFS